MTLAGKMLGIGVALALALSAGSSAALAKKKKKCKDGEVTKVASYKLAKGEHIDYQIPAPLNGKGGDPKRGVKWMTHRRQGNCIACHKVTKILNMVKPNDLKTLKRYGFHGNIGPSLDGVASRYTEGELRLLVVDPKKVFPDTIMPAFHKNTGFTRVHKDCKGYVVLSADRVEDVVAFLKTLK